MSPSNGERRVLERLRAEIGGLPPGAQLPSVRSLIARHRVSPATVQHAVAQLIGEGLVETRPGSGTFVTARDAPLVPRDFSWQSIALGPARTSTEDLGGLVALPPAGSIVMSTGYLPAELQPTAQLAGAMRRALRRPGVWDRIPREGLEPLRAWFALQLGNGFRAHDVIVCPGGIAALATAFRALAPPGAAVAVESPTYLGAMTAARAAGLRLVPVPTDADGVRPDRLGGALAASGARVFYCQPTYSNPTATVLAAERRRQVLEQVHAAGAFLIEDDWARDLVVGRHAPPAPLASSDPDGHVIYVRSLTKPVAPGVRVAALCARGPALARLRATRMAEDSFVPGPLQEAALQFVTSPSWRQHLRRMQAVLRERRDALVAAVRSNLGPEAVTLVPEGGFHLWARLPDEVAAEDVAARAAQENVVVAPGTRWFPAESHGSFLRISFAGAPPDALRRGVNVLARAVRR